MTRQTLVWNHNSLFLSTLGGQGGWRLRWQHGLRGEGGSSCEPMSVSYDAVRSPFSCLVYYTLTRFSVLPVQWLSSSCVGGRHTLRIYYFLDLHNSSSLVNYIQSFKILMRRNVNTVTLREDITLINYFEVDAREGWRVRSFHTHHRCMPPRQCLFDNEDRVAQCKLNWNHSLQFYALIKFLNRSTTAVAPLSLSKISAPSIFTSKWVAATRPVRKTRHNLSPESPLGATSFSWSYITDR